jgi:hypothetical protein
MEQVVGFGGEEPIVFEVQHLLYCDFEVSGYKSDNRPFEEVSSLAAIRGLLERAQTEYNQDFQYCPNPNRASRLVFFDDAVNHIMRI